MTARQSPTPWPGWIVPAIGDAPDVTGLRRTAIEHDNGELYLERYHLVDGAACSIRIHHWCASDDDRAPHDHPWSNATTVLAGTLLEHDRFGETLLEPGTIVTRPATDPHRIEVVTDDAWTLFVTGPIVRRWGFHTAGGWVHWTEWPHAGRYR